MEEDRFTASPPLLTGDSDAGAWSRRLPSPFAIAYRKPFHLIYADLLSAAPDLKNLTCGSHRKTSLANPATMLIYLTNLSGSRSEIYHEPSFSSPSSLNEAETPEIVPTMIKLILTTLSPSGAAFRRLNSSELLMVLSDLKTNQNCLSSKLLPVKTYPDDCSVDRRRGQGFCGAAVVKLHLGRALSSLGFGPDLVNFVTGPV